MSSRTGLIPVRQNCSIPKNKRVLENLRAPTSKRIEFSIRPLGVLYNPYSKGCSVLCNHPAPSTVRNIIRKVKDSLYAEGGKNPYDENHANRFETVELNNPDHIPEDLFRRYTDTDSRPLTPSPTSGSVRTKISGGSFLNARRCVTPEPGKDVINKRKKIILDLRRSHSQETLHWKASSEISQPAGCSETSTNALCEKSSPPLYQERKTSSKTKKIEESKTKSNVSMSLVCEMTVENDETKSIVCINERDPDDMDYLQRRGKRRKKSKTSAVSATFHLSQDPETQVSTLGPDSVNASTRPSLVPNPTALELSQNEIRKESYQQTLLEGSFLTEEAFNVLKVELDIDTMEDTFERYLTRARQEALKFLPPKELNETILTSALSGLCFENENKMPRKLSKSSSRFEVPLNLKALEKQIQENEENINGQFERLMSRSSIAKALEEVLGFYGSKDKIEDIMKLIFEGNDHILNINFRSWCGIVAFAERFVLENPFSSDSCDELEKADFESMEERIHTMKVSKQLHNVLFTIRRGHSFI